MQSSDSQRQALEDIEAMRNIPAIQLPTLRGKILDCNGKVLACDKPVYNIYLSYELTRLLDERWQNGQFILELKKGKTSQEAQQYLLEKYTADITAIYKVLSFCEKLGMDKEKEAQDKIQKINDAIWRLRTYMAWKRYNPDGGPMQNFQKQVPSESQRTILVCKERILEMYRNYPVLELVNEDAKFAAEVAFSDFDRINVSAEPARNYPYGETASHLIGWVRPVSDENKKLAEMLEEDPLASYQGQELAGFRGVEWACEPALRGRRGRAEFDRQGNIDNKVSSEFGNDIKLTIDIELNKKLASVLSTQLKQYGSKNGIASVVIDVDKAEILAIVSMPEFDLNQARTKFSSFMKDSAEPLTNRALEKIYPAGSILKPLILIAALQENKITANTIINCPAEDAPKGWPSCWIWRQFHSCHDYQWENTARNAIKGSCNVYCSRAANMLTSDSLQRWLYQFGFGRKIIAEPDLSSVNLDNDALDELGRNIRQSGGVIWTGFAMVGDVEFNKLPKISNYEKRMFGIGQGSMRCTVLQAANEMATIARGGIFIKPKLFKQSVTSVPVDLSIRQSVISVIKDGMYAVVNEHNGTANGTFAGSDLIGSGKLKIYGKTGSTQGSENAWFASFFSNSTGKTLAMAVLIEGGESGAQDAAPIAKEIIQSCVDAGYPK